MAARRRERWYSSDGQHRIHRSALESSKGSRRLISLVLLLVLTLIAIQQVSDSKRVGRVAGAIGLLPKSTVNHPSQMGSLETLIAVGSDPAGPVDPSIAIQMPEASVMEALTLNSSDASISIQSQVLERLLAGAPKGVVESLAQTWLGIGSPIAESNELATWTATAHATLSRWIDIADSLAPEHAALVSLQQWLLGLTSSFTPTATNDQENTLGLTRALRLALDRILLRQFVDNTPWRTDDRLPLIRTTHRAIAMHHGIQEGWLAPDIIPNVSVPQLMTQTANHRGRGVRIAGTIVLIDQPATVTIDGSNELTYGVIWVRPDDGSNQPIVVHLPSDVQVPNDLLAVDQAIAVTGLLAKRRAYASNRGGDIAPVVVAAAINAAPSANSQPPALSPLQRAVAEALNHSTPLANWSPPVDVSGAMERVEQRLASRLHALESLDSDLSASDRDKIASLAVDESLLAGLIGISKVTDEIELLTRAGRTKVTGSTLELVRETGTVSHVMRIFIENPPFPNLEWREVYACIVEPHESASSAEIANASQSTWIVFTSSVPLAWLDAPELRQPCIVQGIALPSQTSSPTSRTLLGASVQWRLPVTTDSQTAPDVLDAKPALNAGWRTLLNSGWNLAWIDLLESLQGQSMSARETEAFYSMLAAAGSLPTRTSDDRALTDFEVTTDQPLDIMDLIRRAEGRKRNKGTRTEELQSVGNRAQCSVQIRRVQRVAVDAISDREWLGADHYYQLDGFADIGRNRIEIQYGEGNQTVVFEREFPITLVAKQVPDWLLVQSGDADGSGSQAWYPRTRIDARGWFYRMWRYKTTQVSVATDDSQSQQSPMLVVDHMELAQAKPVVNASNASPTWITATSTIIGVLGALFIAWKLRQGLTRRR